MDKNVSTTLESIVTAAQRSAHVTQTPWRKPLVTHGGDSLVTLEWWHGQRKLTIDIEFDHRISYTKVWGPDIYCEMDDGFAVDLEPEVQALWAWLHH
jgi:hypothetical protein